MSEAVASSTPRRRRLEAVGFAGCVFACLLASATRMPMVWDEGLTLDRTALLDRWLGLWTAGDASPLGAHALDRLWRFSREEPDGHGPFYALLSTAGRAVAPTALPPLTRHRLGTILLYAFTAGVLWTTVRRRWPLALTAPVMVAWATLPRVWPEVQFALIDGPLYCLALIAWCAFVRTTDDDADRFRAVATVLFGVAVGCAMANKLTGWLLPAPYILWSCVFPSRRGFARLGVAAAVALATCLLLNVGWWPDPVAGLRGYFESNLTRRDTIAIDTMYLGTVHHFGLPWHNTLVWTVFAVPPGVLVLGAVGVGWSVVTFRRDRFAALLVLNWLLLMVVRALPDAPGHDGTRQIVVAFGFLALLAGHALDRLHRRFGDKPVTRTLVLLAAWLTAADCAQATWRLQPHGLSYSSPLVGGLPGATRRGMEPTYFWEAVGPDVLAWLNANTDAGRTVLFRNRTESWKYLRQWGGLTVPTAFEQPGGIGRAQWIVVQNRPGLFTASDRHLIEQAPPALVRSLDGVPLLWVFPAEPWRDFQRSRERP